MERKYVVIDDCGTDIFTKICESKEDALQEADSQWDYLTKYDKKRRSSLRVVLADVDEEGQVWDAWETVKEYVDFGYSHPSRYNVEYDVNQIVEEVKDEFEVDDYYYGDCYSDEIKDLMHDMEFAKYKADYDQHLAEIREILESYAKTEKESEEE